MCQSRHRAPRAPKKTTGEAPKQAPTKALTWKLLHAHPLLNPLVDICIGDAVKAYFYARPKKAPYGCSKYANHWYDATVIQVISEEFPAGTNRIAVVKYYDGAVEYDVEFCNVNVRI